MYRDIDNSTLLLFLVNCNWNFLNMRRFSLQTELKSEAKVVGMCVNC